MLQGTTRRSFNFVDR